MTTKNKSCLYVDTVEDIQIYRSDYYNAQGFGREYSPKMFLPVSGIGYSRVCMEAILSELVAELIGDWRG